MMNLEDNLFQQLISWFHNRNEKVIVALSGGVDSAVVAMAAKKALDKNAIAVTADYNTLSAEELTSAKRVAKEIDIQHKIIRYNELDNTEFVKNDQLRCYHCRTELATYLSNEARQSEASVCDVSIPRKMSFIIFSFLASTLTFLLFISRAL